MRTPRCGRGLWVPVEKGRKASLLTKFPSASRKWLGLNWCGVSHCVLSSSTEVSDGMTIMPWEKTQEIARPRGACGAAPRVLGEGCGEGAGDEEELLSMVGLPKRLTPTLNIAVPGRFLAGQKGRIYCSVLLYFVTWLYFVIWFLLLQVGQAETLRISSPPPTGRFSQPCQALKPNATWHGEDLRQRVRS